MRTRNWELYRELYGARPRVSFFEHQNIYPLRKKESCKIHYSIWSIQKSIKNIVWSLDSLKDCIYGWLVYILTQVLSNIPCSFYKIGCGRKVFWYHLSNQKMAKQTREALWFLRVAVSGAQYHRLASLYSSKGNIP